MEIVWACAIEAISVLVRRSARIIVLMEQQGAVGLKNINVGNFKGCDSCQFKKENAP